MRDKVRIETIEKSPGTIGPGVETVSTFETVWCDVAVLSTKARMEYQKQGITVSHRLQMRDEPTISFKDTRFVWITNGDTVLHPVEGPINLDGVGRMTTILVKEQEHG